MTTLQESGPDSHHVASWTRPILGVIKLLRPVNFLMFIGGVILGGILTAGVSAFDGQHLPTLMLAALSAALIVGGANAINDVADLEIDRINRPQRPLPSGMISPRTAKWVWGCCSGAGVVLSFFLSDAHIAIAVVTVVLCYWYSIQLKGVLIAGNVLVALVIPLILIVYGGWAVGPPGPAFVGASFAFLSNLAREMVKDMEDVQGDAAADIRTAPLVFGLNAVGRIVVVILLITIVFSALPYMLLGYNSIYLLVVSMADVLMIWAGWIILGEKSEEQAGRASGLLKWSMLFGMMALASASLF